MRLLAKEPIAYGHTKSGALLRAEPGEEFDFEGDASQLLQLGHAELVEEPAAKPAKAAPAKAPEQLEQPAKPAKG